MKIPKQLAVLCAASFAILGQSFAQTNLAFTAIAPTDEQAIRLTWSSVSNHIYEIDEADALINTNTGATTWNTLYNDYPSQGTNTFWLDTGNYLDAPPILHPKYMPMRFYRIVDTGVDTTSDEPSVAIISPTNGIAATGELTITVAASTDQAGGLSTKLYVDGQEMSMPVATTNYLDSTGVTNYEIDTYAINTCEWGNENHTLFATAKCLSGPEGYNNSSPVLVGHAVSPFVSVLFSNLVTRISFSQPSFDPSSGETQQVSAVFAANCNWTLQIEDMNSNVVQTATGSGTSMVYNWDGNGTNETALPAGIYYYYISAETNGESDEVVGGGPGGSGGGSPPSPDLALLDSPQLWAMSADEGDAVPLILYPPGFDTNGLTIFSATPAQVNAARAPISDISFSSSESGRGFSPADSGAGSSAASQNSPAAPQRPPNNPIRGFVGTVGIAYQTYSTWTNQPDGVVPTPPFNGEFGPVQLQGVGTLGFGTLLHNKEEGDNFITAAGKWGLNVKLKKVDYQLSANDLTGSGSPFNNYNLGVVMVHGTYGSAMDYNIGGAKQMYFPIYGGSGYLSMNKMNFGGAGTNGLKWMALMACFSLYQQDWQSMQNQRIYPYNSNLHLLLGTDTEVATNPNLLADWVKYMAFGSSTNYAPMTIRQAWYQAARDDYAAAKINYGMTMKYSVAGDSACSDDMLQTNAAPGGTWFYDTPNQVWP